MEHPGRVLLRDFLEANGLSQYRLAVDIGVPPRRINEIVQGKRGITADTALRLGRYFSETTPDFWMALQSSWELDVARDALGPGWERSVRVYDPTCPPPGRGRPAGRGARGRSSARRADAPRRGEDEFLFID